VILVRISDPRVGDAVQEISLESACVRACVCVCVCVCECEISGSHGL
jgi:hypothetical protein